MTLIVISGAIANKLDQGGEAWVRLSYLLGLRRMGYRVHFLEQITPQACVDTHGAVAAFEVSANRAYFNEVMQAFGLADCSTLLPTDADGGAVVPAKLFELADSADALLNISGHLSVEPLLGRFRTKVFIDIDPGYTQFWHAAGNPGARLAGHDFYYTIGENIGSPDCLIPMDGIPWRTTRPPVVLSEWPVVNLESVASTRRDRTERALLSENASLDESHQQNATLGESRLRFTTIANWRGSFGPVQIGNQTFGQKVHEFRKIWELPCRVPSDFEISLNIYPGDHKDYETLNALGWRITDPLKAASTPDRFRRYVQQSGAEFSVAQGIYMQTNSGWFSDRTTRYLASGKPVLVQDTGCGRHLPVGKGLLTFRTLDEAVAGAEAITADYETQCAAARGIAERYFDSDKVLGRLLEEVGVAP
ncbi:MAG: hypothetical protein WKF77_04410 [Planctomycetaceae bacterium]